MFNLIYLHKLLFNFIKLDLGGGEFSSSIENEQVLPNPKPIEKTNEIPACSNEYVFGENGSIREGLEKLGLGDLYNKHEDIRKSFDEFFLYNGINLQKGDNFKLDISNIGGIPSYNLTITRKIESRDSEVLSTRKIESRDSEVLSTFNLTEAIRNKKIEPAKNIMSQCRTGLNDMMYELNKQKENNVDSLNLTFDEKDFISKYGKVVSNLSSSLNINEATIYSLINRESNFKINAKSGTGSTGYMQLTGSVFNDMNEGGRGRGADRYSSYFKLVPDEIIEQIDGPNKDKLTSALKRAKNGDMIGFSKLNTRENKNNPIFNLILGSVYLKTLKEDNSVKIRGLSEVSFSQVNELLASKNIEISKKDFDIIKSELLNGNNTELLNYYNAFKNYNGDSKKNHKYIYAIAVILGEEKWKNILSKYKA